MHYNNWGKPCNCSFGERLKLMTDPWSIQAATDLTPYEARMWHGSERGHLGPVRIPFWATSHQPEAEGFGSVLHPVSVRFKKPLHLFGTGYQTVTYNPDSIPYAQAHGHDGIVVHFPEDNRDQSDPYPKREWAIGLDPGAVLPGHEASEY